MSLFDNLSDRVRQRFLDVAFQHGRYGALIKGAVSDRRVVRQRATELLARARYERVGDVLCRACVDVCRRRTELWREDKPKSVPDWDTFVESLRKRSNEIEHELGYLSVVAIRLGEQMVDRLLKEYRDIYEKNRKAYDDHYENVYKKDHNAGLYEAPIEPWIGLAILGDVGSDDTETLHKLAALYSKENCYDAIRGVAYAEVIDEPIWDALESAARSGNEWAIKAVGKSGDKRALGVLEGSLHSYLSEGAAVQLAEALSRCGGDRAGKLLEDLFTKNTHNRGDKFIQAVADAFADLDHKPAIPLLQQELSKLERDYGKYPESIVKDKPKYGYRSSWEPGNRSVGHLTIALGRLGVPEVKETIKRILRKPVDTVYEEVDRYSVDYLLRHSTYDPYGGNSRTTWTITYSPWVLYQAALAAGAYVDPEFIPLLKNHLRNDNAIVRYGSVTALSKFVPNNYRDGFGSCLSDKDPLVREAAVRAQGKALAGTSNERAILSVIELMGEEDDGVRAGARAAVITIGSSAVPALKQHVNHPNLRLRVGVLSCLAELVDVRELPKSSTESEDAATIFITPEIALTGDHEGVLRMLQEAWDANVAAHDMMRKVHLEFPVPREGTDGEWERDAVRRWVSELDSKLPQSPFLLTEQALSAWLRLRVPRRKQDLREAQSTGEYGGGASRVALLMELIERAQDSAKLVAGGNQRRQQSIEKLLVERLVSHLQ